MLFNMKGLFVFIITGILLFSCVPAQKFRQVQEQNEELITERNRLMAENEQLSVDKREYEAALEKLEKNREESRERQAALVDSLETLIREYDQLVKRYDDLKNTQETIMQGHDRETRRLLTELQKTQEELQRKEDRLRELELTAADKVQDLNQLRAELDARNQRLVELEKILNKKDSAVTALRDKVSNALLGFQDQGLSVNIRNGKVYVSLEEKLLFKTGSAEVSSEGVRALKRLATVLENNRDINIMIEGHTDDVPVRSNPAFQDNWDLSVKRATSVVRILLDDSTIDPKRLIAAGRGEFLPVDPAKTPGARQKNRRTEIILTPKLDELFRILEMN